MLSLHQMTAKIKWPVILGAICMMQSATILWLLYAGDRNASASLVSKNTEARLPSAIHLKNSAPKLQPDADSTSKPPHESTSISESTIEHPVSSTTLAKLVPDSVFKAGSLEINPQIAHSLKLSREKINKVNDILLRNADNYSIAAVNNAQLVKTPAGDSYFRIAPSTELRRFGELLRSELNDAIGFDAGNTITAMTASRTMEVRRVITAPSRTARWA